MDRQIFLLNLLEEFSLKVKHFGVVQHSSLNSVHAAFVELIEKNAVALFFMREIIAGNPIYLETLSLYDVWRATVGKPNYLKNLLEHKFITKEQRQEILKKQREAVRGVQKTNSSLQ